VIVRVEPGETRVPEPGNADRTLPPHRYCFASGNACVVRPAMRRIPGGPCAITFSFDWMSEPTAEDRAEMTADIARMVGTQPFRESGWMTTAEDLARAEKRFLEGL
jgi:hypothetical protein